MAEKAKVKEVYHNLFKWAAFVPTVLLFPEFVADPVDWRIPFLCIVVAYWVLVFMAPYNLIRYVIKKFDIGQFGVDVFSLLSVVGMWGISIFMWLSFFVEDDVKMHFWGQSQNSFPAALFVIPFISLIYVMGGILSLTLLYKIYYSVIKEKVSE